MSAAPLQFLLLVFAGWVNRRQREVVEYLQEENRVLREQLGDRRLRCLDKLVPLGERHLRVAISEFLEHYHLERNHHGLDNRLITAVTSPANENVVPAASVSRHERLGGILSYYYYRPAA